MIFSEDFLSSIVLSAGGLGGGGCLGDNCPDGKTASIEQAEAAAARQPHPGPTLSLLPSLGLHSLLPRDHQPEPPSSLMGSPAQKQFCLFL